MKKKLSVFLHDVYVGILNYEQGKLTFEYDKDYIQQPSARPISSALPITSEIFSHQMVAPFFSGLLPDEGVRYRLAKYLHLSDKNIFGLLEAIGGECAGAISLKLDQEPQPQEKPQYIVLSEQEVLDVMSSLEHRPFLVGEDDIRISAAGAQCKLMIAFVDGKLAIPKGNTPSTHIIKPNIPGYVDTVFNEYFCMLLAKSIGLMTPNVQIVHLQNHNFYIVERYDRTVNLGEIRRLHQEDFCQILNIPPEIKYESEGGPSLEQCFNVLDTFIQLGRMPGVDKLRLLKLIIFNFLIGNTDAHGKNFSLLYQSKGVNLAPCYDLLSTVVYSSGLKDKMAMKIGGEYQIRRIQKKHWERLAVQIGFKFPFVMQQIKKMVFDIQKQLPVIMQNIHSPSAIENKIKKVIEHQIAQVDEY